MTHINTLQGLQGQTCPNTVLSRHMVLVNPNINVYVFYKLRNNIVSILCTTIFILLLVGRG